MWLESPYVQVVFKFRGGRAWVRNALRNDLRRAGQAIPPADRTQAATFPHQTDSSPAYHRPGSRASSLYPCAAGSLRVDCFRSRFQCTGQRLNKSSVYYAVAPVPLPGFLLSSLEHLDRYLGASKDKGYHLVISRGKSSG